jgi:hypothetical protein
MDVRAERVELQTLKAPDQEKNPREEQAYVEETTVNTA